MGLARRRTKPRARGARDGARNALYGAGDVARRTGHDLGVGAVEVENDHVSVIGEDVRARSDLVDPVARADLPRQVDPLARCKPLAAFRHASTDVAGTTSVIAPNGFLTQEDATAARDRVRDRRPARRPNRGDTSPTGAESLAVRLARRSGGIGTIDLGGWGGSAGENCCGGFAPAGRRLHDPANLRRPTAPRDVLAYGSPVSR